MSPSRLPLRAHFHRERDGLVQGRKKIRYFDEKDVIVVHLKVRLLRPGDAFLGACKSLDSTSVDLKLGSASGRKNKQTK